MYRWLLIRQNVLNRCHLILEMDFFSPVISNTARGTRGDVQTDNHSRIEAALYEL